MTQSSTPSGRYVVIGANGQLGRALMDLAPDSLGTTRAVLDLSKTETLERDIEGFLDTAGPVRAVLNAAAYTAVDAAEEDEETAAAINAVAPEVLAKVCAARDLPFVHVSTDYVFDGTATSPMTPDRPTAPLGVYGRTKRDGEDGVRAATADGGREAILRTSWVYDATGKNFMTTMLRLAETRDALSVVDDQIGRPTYAPDLAAAVLACARGLEASSEHAGTYHVSNTGEPVSWAGFARAIFERFERDVTVTPIPSSEYPTPAQRPAYSVMDVGAFERTFGHKLPDWREALDRAAEARVGPTPP